MQIIGIAKSASSGNQNLVLIVSEVEMDKITGIEGKEHIPHRYRVGAVVNLGKVYGRVKYINENIDALKAAMTTTQTSAAKIKKALPLEDSP